MKNKNSFLVKFAVVAAMVGFFSPSVSVKTIAPSGSGFGAIPIEMNISLFAQVEARRGGGGARRGGGGARRGGGGARRGGSANRGRSSSRNRSTNRNRNKNVNRNSNRNVNRNSNRNVNRNRNVNVNVNRNNRYYGRSGYYGGRALLAFGTGLAIGSMITAASMPSSCVTTYANGVTYRRCGSSYYQPFYEGDTVAYRVVASPY